LTILSGQPIIPIDWAVARQIRVDSDGYTLSLNDNLFCHLSSDSREEFRFGKGDELGMPGTRGKMQALHSSAALVVNVFEYWRKKDPSAIAKICGASDRNSVMHYEAKHANELGGIPSHLDVEFSDSSNSVPLAVEAKFTETFHRHTRRTLALGYLNKPNLWKGLPGCERLAHRLGDEERKRTSFEYLDAPQLLKHILGLATEFGPRGFALLYLWYGLQSLEASQHWREIIEFESMITGDVDFRVMTYQDLFADILKIPGVDQAYLDYLKTRYFYEGYNSSPDKMLAAEDKYSVATADWGKLKERMAMLKPSLRFGGRMNDIDG